jgi:hypothetical protein
MNEFHIYTTSPYSLDVEHIHIDEGTYEELLMLKDDVCRMNREHDAKTVSDYELAGTDNLVRVTDESMKLGGYGYEGWERTCRFDFEKSPWFDRRCIFNPCDEGSIARHGPSSIEELFEDVLLEQHWGEYLDWAEDKIHEGNFADDVQQYEQFVNSCREYVYTNG